MPLVDGIASCDSCNRLFDTSKYHRLLSASWMFRKWHIYDLDMLKEKCSLTDSEVQLISKYVIDEGMCHDEFITIPEMIKKICVEPN